MEMTTEEELTPRQKEQFELYKDTVRDIRYILGQYRNFKPEAWETVWKLAMNPKLK